MLGCLDKSPARLEILQMRDVNELQVCTFVRFRALLARHTRSRSFAIPARRTTTGPVETRRGGRKLPQPDTQPIPRKILHPSIRALNERLARRERTPSTEGEHAFSQCKIPIQ